MSFALLSTGFCPTPISDRAATALCFLRPLGPTKSERLQLDLVAPQAPRTVGSKAEIVPQGMTPCSSTPVPRGCQIGVLGKHFWMGSPLQ